MESQLVRPGTQSYEQEPHNVELQKAPQLGGDDNHEKKSVIKKVKDKAKKLKNSLKLGGHNHNHTGDQEADDDDDDEEETVQDPGFHGAPRYDESAAVKFTNLPAQAEVSPGQTGTGYGKSTPMVTGEDYPPAIAYEKQNPSKKSDPFLRETLGLQDTDDTSSKKSDSFLRETPGQQGTIDTSSMKSDPFLHETPGQQQQVKLEGLKENLFDPKADPLPTGNFGQKKEQSPAGLTGTGYGESTPMVTGDEYPPVIGHEKQNPLAETYKDTTHTSSKKSDPFLQETPGQQQELKQEGLKEDPFDTKADPSPTGFEEAGVMPLRSSLEKMQIHDKEDKKQSSIPLSTNPPASTGSGSHDQFSAQPQQEEPMELGNTDHDESLIATGTPSTEESSPQDNIKTEDHSPKQSSYLQKLSYVTSAITDKFSPRAKNEEPKPRKTDDDESLLATGTGTPSTEESSPQANIKTEDQAKQSTYLEKLSSATITAKNVVASKFGYGEKGDTTNEQSPREFGDESKNNQGVTSVPRELGEEKKNNQGMISSAMDYGKSVTSPAKNVVASKLGYVEKRDTTTGEQVPMELGDEKKNNQGVTSVPRELGEEKKNNQGMISSAMDYGKGITVTAKNVVVSKLGYGEKGDTTEQVQQVPRELGDENKNNQGMASSAVNYGKRVTSTVTDKLTPMYHKVAGTGNVDESKSGGENKGVTVKDYLSEKLRPGDEHRALSKVITNALGKKKDQTELGDEFYDVQGNEGDQGELKLQSSAQ